MTLPKVVLATWLLLGACVAPTRAAAADLETVRAVPTDRQADSAANLAALDLALRAALAEKRPLKFEDDNAVRTLTAKVFSDERAFDHLMDDLDRGRWSPTDQQVNMSSYWRVFALHLLEGGRVEDAVRVAQKVDSPYDLLLMRALTRYGTLVAAKPEAFDMAKAAQATLERNRRAYAEKPTDAGLAYAIVDQLRDLGRYDEALEFTQNVLAEPSVVTQGVDYRSWIEDRRAHVLYEMGRRDEAIEQEALAAGRLDRDRPNSAHLINLVTMLNGAGRHKEALSLVQRALDQGVSGYGEMFVAAERACADVALGDETGAARAISFTAAHAEQNRNARLKALLCANDIPKAADFYAAWLKDPAAGGDALIGLCDFEKGPLPDFDATLAARFAQVRQAPAVKAVAAQIGHPDVVPLFGARWRRY